MHHACNNNNGKSSESDIINGIWENFVDCKIYRSEDKYQHPFENELLKYWVPWNPEKDKDYKTVWQLIKYKYGTCEAWARFFVDTLKVQHIDKSNNLIAVKHQSINSGGRIFPVNLIIKNWDYKSTQHTVYPYFPYTNFILQTPDTGPHHKWKFEDVEDKDGIVAQGTANPPSKFAAHALVKLAEDQLYDPSYGKKYSSIDDFESKAIAGYYILDAFGINESEIGLDLNGENGIENIVVQVDFTCFRKTKLSDLLHPPIPY